MTAFVSRTLTALAACKSPADLYRAQIDIQESATPSEVRLLMETGAIGPDEFRTWLRRLLTKMTAERSEIQPFRLKRLSENVLHYTGAVQARTLVIGFCGRAGVLFMPIPVILQYFTPGECDVLVVRDPGRIGFVEGIAGHSESFSQLIDRLRSDANISSYAEIRTFGTSGGGAAALAGGALLGARRAVCFSGHLPSISARYRAHPGTARLEGVLRDAAPLSGYLCVFSEGNATDSEHARQLAQLFQLRLRPVAGASDHNVIYEAHKKRAAIALFKEVGLV